MGRTGRLLCLCNSNRQVVVLLSGLAVLLRGWLMRPAVWIPMITTTPFTRSWWYFIIRYLFTFVKFFFLFWLVPITGVILYIVIVAFAFAVWFVVRHSADFHWHYVTAWRLLVCRWPLSFKLKFTTKSIINGHGCHLGVIDGCWVSKKHLSSNFFLQTIDECM